MYEESGAATTANSEATSTNDGISDASAITPIMKNSFTRTGSDTTDAAKTVDLSTAEASVTEYTKKISIDASSSVATPEPIHILAQQAPASPSSTASPSVNSAAAEEVERLRREAEQIKAEQLKLEEEIRLAKLKKEQLTKEVKFMNHDEEEDHIEIFCENPIDVMSAITEDHRTLTLSHNDVEVMSQITEARTEARHFSDLQKKKKFMIGFGVIVLAIVIAAVVGGVMNGNEGSGPSGLEGEVDGGSNPTDSPTKSEPTIIDITDVGGTDTEFPTISPSLSTGTSSSPTFNAIYANKVKIQSNNEAILNVFEVKVFDPSGVNIAIGRNASQSSIFDNNIAANAVDDVADTFASTLRENGAWWEVVLGSQLIPIKSITIMNYWCFDESDQANCLARLSDSTLMLMDEDGAVLATRDIGDTTGKLELKFDFETIIESSLPPADSANEIHNKIPTHLPSFSPIQTPTITTPVPAPTSSSPTIIDPSCTSDEGLLSIFFAFGADPTQISWAVIEECTQDVVTVCNKCYQDYDSYSSVVSNNCLTLEKRYTFVFEDPAGGAWPSDSGFTLSYNGNVQSKPGNGGSMPDTTINFGDGPACPTGSPTTKTTTVRYYFIMVLTYLTTVILLLSS